MLLQSRPLYDNKADASLFLPPAAWDPAMRAVECGVNVLISGGRGIGKTSLLRQMQFTLRTREEPVAFVDAAALAEVGQLVVRIRNAVIGTPMPIEEGIGTMAATFDRAPVAGASRQLSRVLREIGQADPTTVLVDAGSSPGPVYDFFGRMRDVLWQQEHQWVVAVDDTDRASVLKPPADAFFDVTLDLEPWKIERLIDLMNRRLEPKDSESAQLVVASSTQAGGNPRKALRALSDALVHHRDPSAAFDEQARLLNAASELGRPAGMLMAELLDRGQASPSDTSLQVSLGVTRSRLTQILRELREHRLVTVETERSDGPGRPRAVYRPALSQ